MKVSLLSVFAAIAPLAYQLVGQPAVAQQLPPLPIQFSPDRVIEQGRESRTSGRCEAGEISAIAYTHPQTQTALSARTSQAQPMLWFHVPTPIDEERAATLLLKNSLGAPLYEGTLLGQTDSTGIIGVPVPINLSVGDLYQWSLSVSCADDETAVVSGWIERRLLDSALRQTFESVDDRNRAALYANYGYLQDTLSALASLRLTEPEDAAIARDWSTFLTDLNLAALVDEPVLDCCQVANESVGRESVDSEENDREEADSEGLDSAGPDSAGEEGEDVDLETDTEAEGSEDEQIEPSEPEPSEPEQPEEDGRTMLQRARDRG